MLTCVHSECRSDDTLQGCDTVYICMLIGVRDVLSTSSW